MSVFPVPFSAEPRTKPRAYGCFLYRMCQVQVRAGHRVDRRERDLRQGQRPERSDQG